MVPLPHLEGLLISSCEAIQTLWHLPFQECPALGVPICNQNIKPLVNRFLRYLEYAEEVFFSNLKASGVMAFVNRKGGSFHSISSHYC